MTRSDKRPGRVPSPTKIVLVEDEDSDVVHFQRVCRKYSLHAEIVIARTGDAALRILRQTGRTSSRPLIVTDLNLPGLTGHELISEIRADHDLSDSVIFVLSTSDLSDDIDRAYGNHVAGYIVKDQTGEKLEAGIAMLARYIEAVALD